MLWDVSYFFVGIGRYLSQVVVVFFYVCEEVKKDDGQREQVEVRGRRKVEREDYVFRERF